jgi:SP family general alpha glucoside:H+ symporter-like MFS transporter
MESKSDSINDGALHVPDVAIRNMSVSNPDIAHMMNDAKIATDKEHDMSVRDALSIYRKGVAWSILLSTGIVMEGYDLVLLGSFYAFPQFQKKYGALQPDGSYQLSASWQSALSNGAQIGEILGLFINGYVSEWLGYRKTMLISLFSLGCFIFIPFFAPNVQTLLVGEILCGIPWGVFQTLTTAYAAEVVPTCLRAYLTTYVNLCWVMGQFIASGVLRGMLQRNDQWAYRIPFALQWMWPLPIFIGCLFAPESPWWLERKGRTEDARRVIKRLTVPTSPEKFDIDQQLAMIRHTNELEKLNNASSTYTSCFRGVNLRRTEIVSCVWAVQALCGSAFMGYSTYFYRQAGLPVDKSFDMSMAQYALGAAGTIGSWFLMRRAGRRTLYLAGLTIMLVLLLVIGCASFAGDHDIAASWAIGSMLLIYTFTYDITVGPVCYSLVAEIPSTRLRTKAIVLARNLYNVVGIVNGVITPYMLNPTAWNWKAKTGFFWAGFCALCLLWCYFRLPEPKGYTYAELDVLFENKVDARRFKSVKVDAFRGDALTTTKVQTSSPLEKVEDIQVENI